MPKLVQTRDNMSLELCDGFLIGRSLECTFVIEDISISRKHCLFEYKNGVWYITDLSSNGISVNYTKIEPRQPIALNEDDFLQMGNYSFKFSNFSVPLNPTAEIYDNEIIIIEDSINDENAINAPEDEDTENIQENTDFEDELTCSVCTELFIHAVTVNCQHSFCTLCIYKWRKNNTSCPICRKTIHTETSCIALNNMVSLMMSRKSDEEQNRRAAVVLTYDEEYKKLTEIEKRATTVPSRVEQIRRVYQTRVVRDATVQFPRMNFEVINLD